jgi:Ca2+-binding RTX toxin-like protein
MPAYDTTIGGFTDSTVASFTAFSSAEQTQALAALNQWAAASGIVFVEVAPGQGDITFANVDFSTTTTGSSNGNFQNAAGIGFYPFGNWDYYTGSNTTGYSFTSDLSPAGAVFMNSQDISNGVVNLGTLLHEIGHAIGMKHPDQVVYDPNGGVHDDVLDPSVDASTVTIMSETGDAANAADPTLFALDQSAAADLYGPAGTGEVVTGSTSGSNSVSNWVWDDTTETLTQTAVSATETIHGTSVDDVIYGYDYGGATPTVGHISLFGLDGTNTLYAGSGTTALYGGPGVNTLVGGAGDDSFYVYSDQTTVTDNYTTGNNTLYAIGVNFTLPENVDTLYLSGPGLTGTGNDQDDTIFGDGIYASTLIAGSGNDYIVGGAGADTIVAGSGDDIMFGGGGHNTYIFKSVADMAPGSYIGDFLSGQDKIDLSGIATSAGQTLTFIGLSPFTGVAGQVNEVQNGSQTLLEGDLNGDGIADFQIAVYSPSGNAPTIEASDLVLMPTCYVTGTRILTVRGEVEVENLRIGDLAITASGATRPIRWIGHRRTDFRHHPFPQSVKPVRISAYAFGPDRPARDLYVSPGHAICVNVVEEVLIPASALLNGSTIQQIEGDETTYWHVELDSHGILLAEGLPAESYLDMGNRGFFVESGIVDLAADPDAALRTPADFCRPFHTDGALVEVVRAQLVARARALGWTLRRDPLADLHLIVDGARIDPAVRGGCVRFSVPAGARQVALASNAARPIDVGRGDDWRSLGVCVLKLSIDDGFAPPREIALDEPLLDETFHGLEREGEGVWRWTKGCARLPAALWADHRDGFFLRLHLAGDAMPNWVAPGREAVASEPRIGERRAVARSLRIAAE